MYVSFVNKFRVICPLFKMRLDPQLLGNLISFDNEFSRNYKPGKSNEL